jgi:aminodeoxyfutalosine synthase
LEVKQQTGFLNQILDHCSDPKTKSIGAKVLAQQRITPKEGLWLYEKAETGFLSMLADVIRQRLHGDQTYYIRNFHLEPTNICINRCRFCSFSHHFSNIKWEHTHEQLLDMIKQQPDDMQEVHITGAVHPQRDLYYYGDLVKLIKSLRPQLHIKAYSAVEIDHMIANARLSYKEGLQYLIDQGLGSLPGGGAEIFDADIRAKIAATKSSADTWLRIHQTAHELGIPSNATMLYGHLESYEHRIDHMERLRQLQDQTHGFNAFIPLKFKNWNNEMEQLKECSVVEDMRNYAVSRIFLDNIPHLKGYWPAIGKENARLALSFGVDDMDGTINDSTRIYSLAGSGEQNPQFTVSEMKQFILDAKRIPVERDSYYHILASDE